MGEVRQGTASTRELVVRVTELEADSIPSGAGSFDVVLSDSTGGFDEVSFTDTPTLAAPGSLGVTVTLTRRNVLTVQIVDSDSFNVEQVTVEGLRLNASTTAPAGPLSLTIGACTGSLAGCAADEELPSPGTVVASS